MAGDELIELKFRLADGTDIGPSKYSLSNTVGSVKEKIIAEWPKDNQSVPKTINDMKLINAGRILENNKMLAESRLPIGDVPGGVVTMHVVVRPPLSDKNNGNINCKMFTRRRAGVCALFCNPKYQVDMASSVGFYFRLCDGCRDSLKLPGIKLEPESHLELLISHSKMSCSSSKYI